MLGTRNSIIRLRSPNWTVSILIKMQISCYMLIGYVVITCSYLLHETMFSLFQFMFTVMKSVKSEPTIVCTISTNNKTNLLNPIFMQYVCKTTKRCFLCVRRSVLLNFAATQAAGVIPSILRHGAYKQQAWESCYKNCWAYINFRRLFE